MGRIFTCAICKKQSDNPLDFQYVSGRACFDSSGNFSHDTGLNHCNECVEKSHHQEKIWITRSHRKKPKKTVSNMDKLFQFDKEGGIILPDSLLKQKEMEKLTREKEKVEAELKKVEGKLSNKKFLAHAPEPVVIKEKDKRDTLLAKRAKIEENMKRMADL